MRLRAHVAFQLAVIAVALCAGALPAQSEPIKFEDLRAPSSPVFVLMGIESQSIEHPKSPRAFGVSLLQNLKDGGTLPKNYAIEAAPFWLVSHPDLKFRPYDKESVGTTLIQTLSVSAATNSDSNATKTSLGLGVRALLLRGTPGSELRGLLKTEDSLLKASVRATTEAEENRLAVEEKEVALKIQKALVASGLRLEIAMAGMGSFQDGNYNSGEFARYGFWITPSFHIPAPELTISGVLRYIKNRGDRSGANADYGLRASLTTNRFSASFEMVGRSSIDATITNAGAPGPTTGTFSLGNTHRTTGSVEYVVNPGSTITFTFGRNFSEGPGSRDLIASLGVNLGFGVIPVIAKPGN